MLFFYFLLPFTLNFSHFFLGWTERGERRVRESVVRECEECCRVLGVNNERERVRMGKIFLRIISQRIFSTCIISTSSMLD